MPIHSTYPNFISAIPTRVGIVLLTLSSLIGSVEGSTEGIAFFENRIRPVLVEHCYKCHGDNPKKLKGNLFINSRDGLLTGGDNGPALVPGDPEKSLIMAALHWEDDLEMPPKEKLPASVVTDFKKWIAMGAPDPREGKIRAKKEIDLEKGRQHWAFLPLSKTIKQGVVGDPTLLGRNEIDYFIGKKLHASALKQNPEASRSILIRRLFMDLIGLPPTLEEMRRFEKMPHEKIVNELLNSPHFGERWARHWLDVARFAESNGYEVDSGRRGAFQFRDWVIRSFNVDMPFDQFVCWQLAGDQLAPNEPDAHIATGFIVAGPFSHPKPKAEELIGRYDELDDIVGTIGSAFLAQTLACARCHDHKFEAIPQVDYYAIAAAFAKTDRRRVRMAAEKVEPLKIEILPEIKGKNQALAPAPMISAYVARDILTEPVHFLVRGEPKLPKQIAEPGFVQVIMPGNADLKKSEKHPRVALANWLVDAEGGAGRLTARVIVNRLWYHHFGRGIVDTPNDFGTRGEEPSHPELLDFLASRLIENGWRLKSIHRLILNSATWRQSSISDIKRRAIDIDNRLLWRQNVRRIDAEPLRDSLLAVGGTLDLTPFGEGSLKSDFRRRSVYFETKRTELIPFLQAFNAPSGLTSIGKRDVTTVAPQALLLLNDPLVRECAANFAKNISGGKDVVLSAYQIALGRMPSDTERRDADAFIAVASLKEFCQALLISNEFVYVR